ncbi:MAG: hypothetical protein WC375_06490 [Methanomassiliicoccales archaeon]|jgi:hypothetical protein
MMNALGSIPRSGMHALALLAHVSEHPDEIQSLRKLSDETGVPYESLRRLIIEAELGSRDPERGGGPPVLEITAYEYRYSFRIHREWHEQRGRGKIIEAARSG